MHQLNWTDEQWDRYYKQRVNIGLDFLDSLATAVELLSRGSRLSKDECKCWETTAGLARDLVDTQEEKI